MSVQTNKNAICLTCLNSHEVATSLGDAEKPQKDDIGVCYYCGTVATYNENLCLAPMSQKALIELRQNEPETYIQVARAVSAIRSLPKR